MIKERPITIVLIAPKRNKNSLWFRDLSPKTSFPIRADCDAPKPGKNAVNGLAIIDARDDFTIDFFDNFIFLRGMTFWEGILAFLLRLIRMLLAPNNPVSKGRSGSLMFIFRLASPKNPARRNMINAQSFLSFSE